MHIQGPLISLEIVTPYILDELLTRKGLSGGRTQLEQAKVLFQSTSLTRGTTGERETASADIVDFNPRPSHEGRL